MGQESLILHKYIKDYMHANNRKPYDVKLTEPMILLVKSARKNKNNIQKMQELQRKTRDLTKQKVVLEEELKEVQLRKDEVEKTFKILDKEFAINVEKPE